MQILAGLFHLFGTEMLEFLLRRFHITVPVRECISNHLVAHDRRSGIETFFCSIVILALLLPPIHCIDHFFNCMLCRGFRYTAYIRSSPFIHHILELHQKFSLSGFQFERFEIESLSMISPQINCLFDFFRLFRSSLPSHYSFRISRIPFLNKHFYLFKQIHIRGSAEFGNFYGLRIGSPPV